MNNESKLQISPKDGDSTLSLRKVKSDLIARGRRDAEAIERRASETIDPLSETRRLAEAGNATAQHSLGYSYWTGHGVSQDYVEAMKWYRRAADQGYAASQANIGYAYHAGKGGVSQDFAEAMKWYRKAADQGLANAQFNLGNKYCRADGVPQDSAEAAKWYRKAAEQGHASAQFNLGLAYATGDGVPQDPVQAYIWLSLAASTSVSRTPLCPTPTGDEQKMYSAKRDAIAAKMTPQQIAEAERLTREWKATPKGGG